MPSVTQSTCRIAVQAARRDDAKRAQREKAAQAEKLKKAEAAAARAAGQAAASAGVAKDGHEVCRILDSSPSVDTRQWPGGIMQSCASRALASTHSRPGR